jgi:two-component system, response regulator
MAQEQVEILLVEENPDDLELVVHAVRKGGLANQVEVAPDGEQARDFLFCRGAYAQRSIANPPRIVLLDLKLPQVNGLQVLEQSKGNPATKVIPVAILTASREQQKVKNYRLGGNSYIQKPVDFGPFRTSVKQESLFWLVLNQPPPASAFQEK